MSDPHLIVLFGATGDLARRKLLPGILHLLRTRLVADSRIVAVSMDDLDDDGFRRFAQDACREFGRPVPDGEWDAFAPKLHYVNVADGPARLAEVAARLEQELGGEPRRLHYLSVPPKAALDVVATLDEAGLAERSRIIMEKPFGTDLVSAPARRRRSTSSRSGSRTACSSRSGPAPSSTTCRSTCPKR
jgi:glucose-6-phosphate 1-dehydrogenase